MKNGIISFGIGCFHFSFKKQIPFEFNGSDYVDALKKTLEGIPNVSNVQINCPDDFINYKEKIDDEDYFSSEGLNLFPYPSLGMDVQFEIFIPERIQNEITRLSRNELYTEHFRVKNIYTYFLPFAFVELINPSQIPNPSIAVMIIREFLKSQINKEENAINLECLGPSPFHADFYLTPGDYKDSNEILRCVVNKLKGYDSIKFEYDDRIITKSIDAKEYFLEEVGDEFGLFYHINNGDLIRMQQWENLQALLAELIELNKTTGLKYTWFRITQVYGLIQEITIMLTEFESADIDFKYEINKEFRDINRERTEGYLNEYLKEEINEIRNYPTNQVREILNLIENRRSKRIENLIAIFSALIGGIVGSLITLFLSN